MRILHRLMATATLVCTVAASAYASPTFVGGRTDFRDETIYFAMTTRFYDGDHSNNTYCWDGKLNVNDPEWRGDFKGLIQKLDYIKALGFTAIWITPIVENASGYDYHGYHAFNFNKVDPRYESQDCTLQTLVDAVHAHGMKLIVDVVLNHTGNFGEDTLCPEFVKDYSQNLSNINKSLKLHPNTKLSDNYYNLPDGQQYQARLAQMKNTDGVNHDTHNYWHHFGSFNWDDDTRWWAQIAGDCVDLNTENPATTNYLVSCYAKFIRMGVDGFRIDTTGHIPRLSFNKAFIPKFLAIANEPAVAAKRGGVPFYMFGECCARYTDIVYRDQDRLSCFFYTWNEDKNYAWDESETSWDTQVVPEGSKGTHTNITSVDKQAADYMANGSEKRRSTNCLLSGNNYHTPDYSQASGLNVIDFPMHWNFNDAAGAWNMRGGDNRYNDASFNVVYVDSHDYAPDQVQYERFSKPQSTWAENLDLMFTFRGIPCIYYGSEIEFKKGKPIDKGPTIALKESGRAYFGGYIEGSVNTTDFAQYSGATGNMAASLSYPLSLHIQRLNLIRAAVPALRKGQYSTEGCSGTIAFKRRYTDSTTDSYALVCINGNATFTGVLNGKYVDAVTGNVINVTDGKLSATCSGKGNMRVYVLDTALTPAPGKVGTDGKYLYATTPVEVSQQGYDGNEEPEDTETVRDDSTGGGGGSVQEPDEPIAPSMAQGEQAVFFENTADWGGTIRAWVWNGSVNYTGGSWPGQACTYLGNKIWKWTYTGTDKIAEGAGLIFNNGQSQTDDLAWHNGGYYDAAGNLVKTIEGAGEIPDQPVTPSDPSHYTAYFDNTSSAWSTVYTWVWDAAHGNKNYSGGNWPGKQLSIDTASGYYKFECDVTDAQPTMMIIFSNNGKTQTADLEFVNNGIYNANGYTGQTYAGINDITVDDAAGDGTVTYTTLQGVRLPSVPAAPGLYLRTQHGKTTLVNRR